MRRVGLWVVLTIVMGSIVFPSSGVPGPALTVDLTAPTHPISPYIYGMNFASAALGDAINLPVNRFGGNDTSRYDYTIDTSSKGMDWYFSNIPYRIEHGEPTRPLPDQSNVFRYIRQNQAWGGDTIVTVPMLGYMPKDEAYRCSYPRSLYPNQTDFEPWHDCGNGINPGNIYITDNDPLLASRTINQTFVTQYVTDLVAEFGAANAGGVRFYNLDNEPMLWFETHRDVFQGYLGYDGLRDRTYLYAAAVKAVDPAALTLGPAGFGWTEYFYSDLDRSTGGAWWANPIDRNAHGGVPLAEWYLQQMAAYEQTHGVRILDYFDEHFYPQNGVALNENVSTGGVNMQALRLRSTRALWDPTYIDESWISDGNPTAVMLIPRMRAWVNEHYPGTKLAISEYNWGALSHINGALAQADILGIFGREALDLATLWAPPSATQPGAYAFRMYLNYDGADSTFGDISVSASSANQDVVSVYAARRVSDGALTIMVINKTNTDQTSAVTIIGYDGAPAGEVWRYSPANLNAIVRAPDTLVSGGVLSETFPANSISLLVLYPSSGVMTDLLTNGSFEDGQAGWTVINKSGDKEKCNAATPQKVAHIGECGFQLKATAGVTTKVRQPLSTILGAAGNTVALSAWSKAKKLAATVQIKAVLKTTAGKQVVKFKVPKGTHAWQSGIRQDTLAGDLTGGKVELIIKPGTGKVFIDDVQLNIGSGAGLLPPPALPEGFRG